MHSVVITGVSTGIGYACAQDLVRRGFQVFGSVRKPADAERLQRELGSAFTPLIFDVTDGEAVRAAADLVSKELAGRGLAGLVNNAGIVVPGPLLHLSADELRHQFDVNVVAVLGVTQAFAPLLGARRDAAGPPGRIVMISSVSGRVAYPFVGPYAASKHALEALSDSLRRELMLYGIDVIVIQPGAINTPIWDKAQQIDAGRYRDTDYYEAVVTAQRVLTAQGRRGLGAERVGELVGRALTAAHPRTRYTVLENPWTGWWLPRTLPTRWMDRLAARTLGLRRLTRTGA